MVEDLATSCMGMKLLPGLSRIVAVFSVVVCSAFVEVTWLTSDTAIFSSVVSAEVSPDVAISKIKQKCQNSAIIVYDVELL
jgi:hypothetical protein